jgi:regulator of replication initiation timing
MASVAEQLNKVVEKTERLIELCAALQEENDLLKLESEALKRGPKSQYKQNKRPRRKASCVESWLSRFQKQMKKVLTLSKKLTTLCRK